MDGCALHRTIHSTYAEGPDLQMGFKDGIAVVKMEMGEDYLEALKEACQKLPGTGAAVISSIGQLTKVSLGYFREKGDYHPRLLEAPLELLNVSGIISKGVDGPFPHLHAIVGDTEKRTFGGHLLEARVGVTAETVLILMNIPVERRLNEVHGTMDLKLT